MDGISQKTINILFIAYEFPPLIRGGAFRPAKFAKYLPEFGINPVVFTLAPNDFNKVYDNYTTDEELQKDLQGKCQIIHINSENVHSLYKNKLSRFFNIYFNVHGGSEAGMWKKNFITQVEKASEKIKFDLVYVTAPPFSIIESGKQAADSLKVPLIIDMRDSMSMWVSKPYASYLHYYYTLQAERSYFSYAQAVIGVTDQLINDWKKVHPELDPRKFHMIPNGFDSETKDLAPITLHVKDDSKLIIGYTGSFYYQPSVREMIFQPWWKKKPNRMIQYVPRKEDWLYRSPYFLFKTVNKLIQQHPEFKNKVELRFAGSKPGWFDGMVKEFDLENNVKHLGMLKSEEVDRFENNCDMLLCTSTKVIGGEDYCIASKSFEYIKAGKPILGLVTEGAQKNFLMRSGLAILLDPDNTEACAETIADIIKGKKITLQPDKIFLAGFERRSLTASLAELIKKLTRNHT